MKDNKNVDIEITPEAAVALDAVFEKNELPFFMEARLLVEDALNLQPGDEMPDSGMRIIDTLLGLYDENIALTRKVEELERRLIVKKSQKNAIIH